MAARASLRVTERAEAEIRAAAEWWRANRPAAPDVLVEDLTEAFTLVQAQPRIGGLARNAKLSGVRRVYLARVRYHLYYRESGDAVEVLAFWHASRSLPRGV